MNTDFNLHGAASTVDPTLIEYRAVNAAGDGYAVIDARHARAEAVRLLQLADEAERGSVTLTRAALVELLTTAALLGNDRTYGIRSDATAHLAEYGLKVEGYSLDKHITSASRLAASA